MRGSTCTNPQKHEMPWYTHQIQTEPVPVAEDSGNVCECLLVEHLNSFPQSVHFHSGAKGAVKGLSKEAAGTTLHS